jgi:hypothetical protein
VKTYRSPDGEQRIWFEDDEIEHIMEDELRRAKLMPDTTNSVVDLEAFIEDHLKATLDHFATLDPNVLGLTEFIPNKSPAVRINKDLSGSAMDTDWCPPGVEGRWRATLAHEAAHVVLHRLLFELDENQTTLFADPHPIPDAPQLLRCLKRDVAHRVRTSDWREVQANKGMAALLMPKPVFVKVARAAHIGASPAAIDATTRSLATQFGVSRQATTIRLRRLGFIRDDDTNALFAIED